TLGPSSGWISSNSGPAPWKASRAVYSAGSPRTVSSSTLPGPKTSSRQSAGVHPRNRECSATAASRSATTIPTWCTIAVPGARSAASASSMKLPLLDVLDAAARRHVTQRAKRLQLEELVAHVHLHVAPEVRVLRVRLRCKALDERRVLELVLDATGVVEAANLEEARRRLRVHAQPVVGKLESRVAEGAVRPEHDLAIGQLLRPAVAAKRHARDAAGPELRERPGGYAHRRVPRVCQHVTHVHARALELQLEPPRLVVHGDGRAVHAHVDGHVVGELLFRCAFGRRPQAVAAEEPERPAVHRVPAGVRRLREDVRAAGRREPEHARPCVDGDLDAQVRRLDNLRAHHASTSASASANGRTGVYVPGVAWSAWNTSKPR